MQETMTRHGVEGAKTLVGDVGQVVLRQLVPCGIPAYAVSLGHDYSTDVQCAAFGKVPGRPIFKNFSTRDGVVRLCAIGFHFLNSKMGRLDHIRDVTF